METSLPSLRYKRGVATGSAAVVLAFLAQALIRFWNELLHGALPATIVVALVVLSLCATFIFLVGVPVVLLLERLKLYRLWVVALTAALAGSFLSYLQHALLDSTGGHAPLLVGGAYGFIAGLGFYFGARPNSSFKPTPLRGAA